MKKCIDDTSVYILLFGSCVYTIKPEHSVVLISKTILPVSENIMDTIHGLLSPVVLVKNTVEKK